MSSRTVSVVLTAQVQNYLSNMRAAEERTREVERAARTATQQFAAHNEALGKIGAGAAVAGGAVLAGLGLAIKASTEYGAKLAQLQSLSHASRGEMQRLSDAAMTQGRAFGQSALDVADAEIELTKAGRSTSQMLGGDLKGALALAAAGQMDVAEATSIGVTAITQFADSGATIPHVADLLAAGADKALGSVQDLGAGLKQGGLVAAQMGLSVDDTVGTLSAFAQAGLIGADAGTSLKTMLLSLQSPSTQAQKALERYNITAYDSQGAFVGITNLAGQLHDKLGGVTQAQRDAALSTIFGSDAIRSANVLYKEGSAGIGKWIKDVNDTGFASAQAAGKLNSLQGDLTKLGAAWENAMIKAGGSTDGFLRGRVQSITKTVEALSDMPAPLQAGAVGAAAVAGSVALMGGAMLIVVPKIVAARTALAELGVTGRGTAALLGKGSALLLGVTSLIGGFAGLAEHGTASEEGIKKTGEAIKSGWAGIDKLFGSAGTSIGAGSGLKASLRDLTPENGTADIAKFFDGATLGITKFSAVYKGNEATFDAMGQQLAGLAEQDYSQAAASFSTLVQQQHLGVREQKQLLTEMPAYREQLVHLAKQAGAATDEQSLLNIAQGKGAAAARVLAVQQALAANGGEEHAAALQVMRGAADQATTSVDDLANAIEGLDGGQLSARAAARKYQQAIDDATAAIAKNGKTANRLGTELDITTDKGRDNQEQLDGIADATKTWAASMTKAHAPASAVNKVLEDGKKQYAEAAHKMGLTKEAANLLAEALLGIPKVVQPRLALTGAGDALDKLQAFEAAVNRLNGTTAHVDAVYSGPKAGDVARRAAGGSIDGPGAKGFDSVPAMLAPGEHVLTANDVDLLGGQGGAYRFRAALRAGDVQAFAKGGAVSKRKKPKAESAIARQDRIASTKRLEVKGDTDQIVRAKRTLKARERAEARAQKAYDAIGSGKKSRTAKRRARAALDTAKKRTTSAERSVKSREDERDRDLTARTAALATAKQLRQDREDFVSAERRNPNRRTEDPLAYVDQLRSMSRDEEKYSAARRKSMAAAANQYESTLVKLTKSSEAAAEKLANLRQASDQLRDSIASAVSGGYRASSVPLTGAHDATTTQVASGWITRNGMRLRTYSNVTKAADPGRITAGGIAGYYTAGASAAKRFADDLAKLTRRGYPDTLVAEVAGYGVEQGQPIITALLAATASQQGQITSGYNSIGSSALRAGTTVAADSYAQQITAAKANADQITEQIKGDGEKLRKLIAAAFGLKGYASGTASAAAGIRWVGEDGPELVGFKGGERVLTAADSSRWVRGSSSRGSGGPGEITIVLSQPDALAITDADGVLRGTMRVEARGVAHEVVTQRTDQIAVRVLGATA